MQKAHVDTTRTRRSCAGLLGHGLANHASSGRPCVVLVRGARRVRPAASLHARAAVVVMESSARGQRRGDLLPA